MIDEPEAPPIARLLQFGPIVGGFRYVYAGLCETDDGSTKFVLDSDPINAFGLAELAFPGALLTRIEVVGLFLESGRWQIANIKPEFCGIIRDGDPLENALVDIDPYYEERLIGAAPATE